MAKNYFRAAKVCPGAREAYEMLRQSAACGDVSDETLEKAVVLMCSKGASKEEAFHFLCRCCAMDEEDVEKIRNVVRRCEEKIHAVSDVQDGFNG